MSDKFGIGVQSRKQLKSFDVTPHNAGTFNELLLLEILLENFTFGLGKSGTKIYDFYLHLILTNAVIADEEDQTREGHKIIAKH